MTASAPLSDKERNAAEKTLHAFKKALDKEFKKGRFNAV